MIKAKNLLAHIFEGRGSRRTVLVLFDILCFILVDLFFYWVAIHASHGVPVQNFRAFLWNSGVHFALLFVCRWLFGVYRNVWRYSYSKAYFAMVLTDGGASVAALLLVRLLHTVYPGVYYGLWHISTVGALFSLLTLMSRFTYSLLYKVQDRAKSGKPRIPVAIVGAGRLGSYLAGDLRNNPNSGFVPMFYVDTDVVKNRQKVGGIQVYDPKTAEEKIRQMGIRDVIIAIAHKDSEQLSKLYYHYRDLGCKVRVYDSLVDKTDARKGVLREFSIEDLLFRKPIAVNDAKVHGFFAGKTVLVTGGGGSIGSELCRQIADCEPQKLVIFDIYENNAYDIQQELLRKFGDRLHLVVEIGSVRDPQRLEQLFAAHKPHVVFHAAAHKHVPLMESSAAEAVKNNCMGTYNTANAAEKYGVEKFILISSDKAVNPTNVMGASKRMCEMILQCRTDSATNFAAVRFGNVLGSNGSVIPLFQRQIAAGGPVTITDKRIIRYFMTIPEAAQLVLQAGAMAKKGELFVLDMGKPVRIYDLAVNLIQLSGLEPETDIAIQEIGLRPGEKLYEELLMKTEQLDKTENDLIFIERDTPYSRREVEEKLAVLQEAVRSGGSVHAAMAQVVPTYRSPEEINREAEKNEEMQQIAAPV